MAIKEKTSTFNRVEQVLLSILSALKLNVTDYCDLETTEGGCNIVLKNGALMTICAFDGTKTIVDTEDTFYSFITDLTKKLKVYMGKSGHQFGMVFKRDLDTTSDLYKIAEIKKQTARTLDLDVDHIIDEETKIYAKLVYDETNYLIFISNPCLVDKSEYELELKRKHKLYQEYDIPAFAESQNIMLLNSYLKSQHETFVEGTLATITANKSFAAQVYKLNVVEALRAIKKSVSPQNTHMNWQPQIPGLNKFNGNIMGDDIKIPVRWKISPQQNDASNILWAPLPEQIMRSTIQGIDRASKGTYPTSSVITENKIYCPLMVSVLPQNTVSFNDLFVSLNNASTRLPNGTERAIPYCVSFMITGDALAGLSIKKTLASILAVASSDNANIKGAFNNIQNYLDVGEPVAGIQISAMTWAENNTYGIDEIQIRRSKLWRILESWGGTQVSEKGGDPILGFTSNLVGVSSKHHAPKNVAPLWNALHFLPWTRPASPFQLGTILNRSVDGKLIKLEQFSSELTTWVKIYQGRPGSGKSMAMNNDIIECCLLPGLKRLPYIFMMDVGESSRGAIELIRDHLPPEKRHLAVYRRLKNTKEYAINPLECSVGRMEPTSDEISQIVAFLSTLITPVEAQNKAERGLTNFLSMVVKSTFISKKDNDERGRPNIYERYVDAELDNLMENIGIDPHGKSYFSLVNICHDQGHYRARDLCQRYAMPTLHDAIAVISSDKEIQTRYRDVLSDSGSTMIDMFRRGVTEAISMYECFAHHTQFDVSTARVVSIDLQDVMGTNSKQISLFFQASRMYSKKKFSYTEDDIVLFPDNFKDYYRNLVEEIMEDKKIMAFDELHRVKEDQTLFGELVRDCKEGRKWNLQLMFASQELTDFGNIVPLATQFVLADRGDKKTHDYMREALSLKDVEISVLSKDAGVGPGGLVYLSRIVGKVATYVSLMVLTIGPIRLWALTSDPDEKLLRKSMYAQAANRSEALLLLSIAYPGGAKKIMAAKREELRDNRGNSGIRDKDETGSIAKLMASEIISKRDYLLDYAKRNQ